MYSNALEWVYLVSRVFTHKLDLSLFATKKHANVKVALPCM